MPTYAYKCPGCSFQYDVLKKLADIDLCEECPCGTVMKRQISAPRVLRDYAGYNCPITGSWVEGRRAHEENLAKHGCRVFELGEREEATRRSAADDARLDTAIEATTEQFIHELPTAKREQLASELAAGASTVVTRASLP
jgi:putative FmdB family regulatory protein